VGKGPLWSPWWGTHALALAREKGVMHRRRTTGDVRVSEDVSGREPPQGGASSRPYWELLTSTPAIFSNTLSSDV
jgi:hypothetical protein